MNPTVSQPVSLRYPRQEQFETWYQLEGGPLLSGLYAFANQREHATAKVTTVATGAYTVIWSEAFPDTTAWYVTAIVSGRATAGGIARAAYEFSGLFYSEGALTQEGATASRFSVSSVAFFNARFNIAGQNLQVQVLDDGVRAMNWTAVVIVQEVR